MPLSITGNHRLYSGDASSRRARQYLQYREILNIEALSIEWKYENYLYRAGKISVKQEARPFIRIPCAGTYEA
jgi:hypothetical protein